jgi:hypothetical protein
MELTMNSRHDYRSPCRLALGVTLFSVCLALADAVAAFLNAGRIQLLDSAQYGTPITLAQAEAWDERQRWLAAVQLTIGMPMLVLFLMWVYRVNRNARGWEQRR